MINNFISANLKAHVLQNFLHGYTNDPALIRTLL